MIGFFTGWIQLGLDLDWFFKVKLDQLVFMDSDHFRIGFGLVFHRQDWSRIGLVVFKGLYQNRIPYCSRSNAV